VNLRPTRFPGLDGLRGIAILAVIGHNLQLLQDPDTRLGKLVEWGLDRGWIGVQLFFVLSGFLITGILLDSQKAPNHFQSFFARRALRIFPLYFLTLAVLFLLLPALGAIPAAMRPTPGEQLPFWLYVSNWTQPSGFNAGDVTHFWSLAVEEQFYLVWPFLLRGRSAEATLRLSLAVAAASLVIRLAMLGLAVSPHKIYMFSVCRMDALALGGAMAAAWRMPGAQRWLVARWRAMLAGAALLWLFDLLLTHGYPRLSVIEQSIGYTILSLSMALLVGAAASADTLGAGGPLAALRSRGLRLVGKYSYAIYLFHRPVNDLLGTRWLAPLLPQPGRSVASTLVYLAAAFGVSFALAALSYRLVERPFLSLKTRYRAGEPEEAPPARAVAEAAS
jgi:peptidoglycan/LPS O-acetylase OafA/YrhL